MGKKKLKKPKSRYTKVKVAKAVDNKFGFRCAWDGILLFDRHHIYEYHKGGEQTEDNLILLCPNCHRQVHKGEITNDELLERRTLYKATDRIGGNLVLSESTPVFRFAKFQLDHAERLLVINDVEVFNYRFEENVLYLGARLYDKKGKLIFWMSSNRWWTSAEFTITTSGNILSISNNSRSEKIEISFHKRADAIYITGRFYTGGVLVKIDEELLTVGKYPIGVYKNKENDMDIAVVKGEFNIKNAK